jgi:hypothetical protein
MSAISSVSSDQGFDHARDQCHASIKLFVIEILVRVLFLPTLVSLLDIYSEPRDSIPLLYSALLFRASSCVKAINHVQLNYSQVVQAHLRSSALVISPVPSLKSLPTPSVDSQVNTTPVRDSVGTVKACGSSSSSGGWPEILLAVPDNDDTMLPDQTFETRLYISG